MFLDPSQEKNKILGIRLNEKSLEEFNKFCLSRKVSKSEIARTAITQYILLNYNENSNPKLIFSKSQFNYILSCLTNEEINQLVEISLQNGTRDMTFLQSIIKKTNFESENKAEIDFQIRTLHRFVFSSEGQAWFDDFSFTWDKNILSIEGEHKLGMNFSEYVQILLSKYFSYYGYELTLNESISRYQEGETQYFLKCRYTPISQKK